jgi:hypothetical protein
MDVTLSTNWRPAIPIPGISWILPTCSNGTNSAGPGYDFVTGLGSLLANNLVPVLKSMN